MPRNRRSSEPSTDPIPDGPTFKPPLKPNRRLMWVSAALLSGWFVFLLVVYFTSIVPARSAKSPTAAQKGDPATRPADTVPPQPAPATSPATTQPQ